MKQDLFVRDPFISAVEVVVPWNEKTYDMIVIFLDDFLQQSRAVIGDSKRGLADFLVFRCVERVQVNPCPVLSFFLLLS